jgi:hypothetical protein
MNRAEVTRCVAADPASVALLMSGPAGVSMWPDADDDTVDLNPPMRSGVGFVVDLSVRDPVVGSVRARLSITPADGATATSLRLVATATPGSAELRNRAALFVDALARCAHARSSAA